MTLTVTDNPAKSRYELFDDGHLVGFTEYHERGDGVLVFPHTVVTSPKRGAGYGSTLVQGALDAVRARGRTIVAEGDLVILEHVEEWQFHTGERILHPFVTVMEVRDGKIVRWHDYLDLNTLMAAAPQAWVEHIMVGYK